MDLLPIEILQHTLLFVDKVCTLNSLKRVNHYHSHVELHHCKNDNNLLLKLSLRSMWGYYSLSANPTITWEIVRDNPNKEWSYNQPSRNTFSRH